MFERFTERARQVIVLAQDEARALRHNYIGTEHILLGLVRENEGVAARVLLDFDADADTIRNGVINVLCGPGRRAEEQQRPREFARRAHRWEYDVRTVEGHSDTWPQQLSAWRQDGWELLTIIEEGDKRRALLERRLS